jgi:hypothetical protein
MKIVGCDLHTRYQQIAMLDQETGELIERRLEHESGEARAFYAVLSAPVRVGIEATGHTRWFERMLAELGHELWIGDAAEIRASMVRKQKTDARDAAHLLELLLRADGFRACGGRRWRNAICGNWCGIGRSWCGCGMRLAINCTRWPWAKGCAGRRSCSPRKGGRS